MRDRVILSGYAGAPEQSRASVNGQRVNISGTAAAHYIAFRDLDKARAEVIRIYRAERRKPKNYIYAFWGENSKQFYYISALTFNKSDDIQSRLYCYKALKHTLQKNPPEIITESGYISPTGAEKPNRETITEKVNYNRLFKICIA